MSSPSNALQQFFNKGFNLTPDSKLNLVISAAALSGVIYYVLEKTNMVHLSFAGNLMSFNNAGPDSAIESITAWIIKRAVDRRTTGENVHLIRAAVNTRRSKILEIINEKFSKTISVGEYKRKLKLIGIEVADELNIALGPQYQPKQRNLDPRGRALGLRYDVDLTTNNPPYGLGTLYPKTVALPQVINKMKMGKAKSHFVRAFPAVSNFYNGAYELNK